MLIGSYVDPPLRLARLVARGSALVIGLEDLAFSRQESELYLRPRQFQGRPDLAYAHLSGWPVGLALVSSEASLHYQPEYLITDLIETLEPGLCAKLPEAAVMDVWEESLAQHLQLDLPPGWLDTVKRLGLPLAPLGNNRFAPHQLLLEMLLSRLRLAPERFSALHARMAALHQEAGDSLAALRLHQRAGHLQEALALARELINRYTERLEMSLVCRTLQDFSPDQLPVEMQLQWAGALLETGQPEAGAALLERVEAQQSSALLRFYQVRLSGAGQNYQAQLDAAEEALRTHPDDLPLLRLKAHALLNLERAEEALQTAHYALAHCPVPLGVEEAQCLYGLGGALGGVSTDAGTGARRLHGPLHAGAHPLPVQQSGRPLPEAGATFRSARSAGAGGADSPRGEQRRPAHAAGDVGGNPAGHRRPGVWRSDPEAGTRGL